jgi:hypothetical protein
MQTNGKPEKNGTKTQEMVTKRISASFLSASHCHVEGHEHGL